MVRRSSDYRKKIRQSTPPGRLRQLQSRTQRHGQSQNQSQNQNDVFCDDDDAGGVCYDGVYDVEESVGILVFRLEWGWILTTRLVLVVWLVLLEWIPALHGVFCSCYSEHYALVDSVGFVGVVAD